MWGKNKTHQAMQCQYSEPIFPQKDASYAHSVKLAHMLWLLNMHLLCIFLYWLHTTHHIPSHQMKLESNRLFRTSNAEPVSKSEEGGFDPEWLVCTCSYQRGNRKTVKNIFKK